MTFRFDVSCYLLTFDRALTVRRPNCGVAGRFFVSALGKLAHSTGATTASDSDKGDGMSETVETPVDQTGHIKIPKWFVVMILSGFTTIAVGGYYSYQDLTHTVTDFTATYKEKAISHEKRLDGHDHQIEKLWDDMRTFGNAGFDASGLANSGK